MWYIIFSLLLSKNMVSKITDVDFVYQRLGRQAKCTGVINHTTPMLKTQEIYLYFYLYQMTLLITLLTSGSLLKLKYVDT